MESEWFSLGVHEDIVRGLLERGFRTPTDIQRNTIVHAIKHKRDIVGAAETGSGKTLAFAIPVLNHILTNKNDVLPTKNIGNEFEPAAKKTKWRNESIDDNNASLVYCEDNIPDDVFEKMISNKWSCSNNIALYDTFDCEFKRGLVSLILTPTRELALQIREHIMVAAKYTGILVCAVVGGMSLQKQERLLTLRPQIVVATPGRLWKMMKEEENPYLCDLDRLKYLVLDEADRMIEHGHFRELSLILEKLSLERAPSTYHTMVFSATLTLPRRTTNNKKRKRSGGDEQSLENLMSKAGLSEDAVIVDLSRKEGTVDRLTESKILCTTEEKDLYLYYFLLATSGRTLIFTNSLDCLYRLKSLLETLKLHPVPLHARMQQRQRLKNLDRFVNDINGLLVASDVAARGLDIPHVQHIIHYQIPKSPEVYVHRSGRTARGKASGSSVMLVGPDDLSCYKSIIWTLNREKDIPNFPVKLSMLKSLRARIKLAKKIDIADHRLHKSSNKQSWLEKTAAAMDVILDDDLMKETEESKSKYKARTKELNLLKLQLDRLLAQEIIPSHISLSYPSLQLVDEQLDEK